MDRQRHWERVYTTKAPTEVSWYAPRLARSLELIGQVAPPPAAVVDVGAGASTLVDDLLDAGYSPLAALDVSAAALGVARTRLGVAAGRIDWIVGDVTGAALAPAAWDVWHDRAVFHFLLDPADREAYAANAARALRPGGHAVIATFATDGPHKCSGLDVERYDEEGLARALGPAFALRRSCREAHVTPWGSEQAFLYCVFERVP